MMKTLHITCLAMLATAVAAVMPGEARAVDFTNERLKYEIVYQWGVIWKHAANATLSIKKSGNGYNAMLVGRTRSWADDIYPVRDTLKCFINNKLQPVRYQKLTHEKNYYARDVVDFTRSGGKTHGKGVRYRPDRETSTVNLSAKGEAYDMLSVFYMLRSLDFANMANGTKKTTHIFSGKEKEKLTITYRGKKTISLRDKSKHNAYHITFSFTTDGGKKSSDAISAYLSTDDKKIPLLLVGKLPVGEVKVYYKK
ncbi:MAG: DUF3108 domain-containing protein [Muribaculaceae bacterium]|nr:DUF3108 domain-containing protein [Muribaculaceae bacterium]